MGYWPLQTGPVVYSSALTSSIPTGANITAGAAHTKGASWTVVWTTTDKDWEGFWFSNSAAGTTSATNTSSLMDIAFGAASSEVVQISNMPCGYTAGPAGLWGKYIPLYVPVGTRITAKVQSAVASKVYNLALYGHCGGPLTGSQCPQVCTTYGANTGTSAGVTVTSSGTTNTLGSWAPISTSTTAVINQLMVGIQGNSSTNITASNIRLQIGVGGSGQEQPLPFEIYTVASSSEWYETTRFPYGITYPVTGLSVPVGSRLSARIASSVATQSIDLVVMGFTL